MSSEVLGAQRLRRFSLWIRLVVPEEMCLLGVAKLCG
jgi:hypothetical protein